jgi:UDP-glucose 4-epimerase
MTILVTGSAGHLGEALMRTLRERGEPAVGLDLKPSPFTDLVGSITDRALLRVAMDGVLGVLHAATLHKPHVATHPEAAFVETNVAGTLALLEESARAGVKAFVFTSTTSAFGRALSPPPGEPAAWITEDVAPVPKNIYGVTKTAAEDLCRLHAERDRLPAVVLRTSRFFPEGDDDPEVRAAYGRDNAQANELLHRRADLADIVDAHLLALERAPALGFGRYIVSAESPFEPSDLPELRVDAAAVIRRSFPEAEALYADKGWRLPASIDRVYVARKAMAELGWRPAYGFRAMLGALAGGQDFRSPLARVVGSKGYHEEGVEAGPYAATRQP